MKISFYYLFLGLIGITLYYVYGWNDIFLALLVVSCLVGTWVLEAKRPVADRLVPMALPFFMIGVGVLIGWLLLGWLIRWAPLTVLKNSSFLLRIAVGMAVTILLGLPEVIVARKLLREKSSSYFLNSDIFPFFSVGIAFGLLIYLSV